MHVYDDTPACLDHAPCCCCAICTCNQHLFSGAAQGGGLKPKPCCVAPAAAAASVLLPPTVVLKVRLHTDKASGRSKGYAHVHFQDEAGLERALTLTGSELMGRQIKVSYGQPKQG